MCSLPSPAPASSRALPLARWLLAVGVLVWLGARHWPETVDDTVISANYARQWAEGHGLTWTTGERVEGYSNFLLVAMLAAGLRLGADAALLAQAISLIAAVVALGVLSARLPRTVPATAAILALAASGPLDHWSMMGLEGPLFGLLLGLGWASVASGRWGRGVVVLALASVTRPEGPLYLGLAVLSRALGPWRVKPGDGAGAVALGAGLAYHLARLIWFGAFWPTPFLVKIQSVAWTRYGFAQVAGDALVFAPVVLAFALSLRVQGRKLAWVWAPLVFQALLLWRASGDWMTHGRLMLPGLLASLITLSWLGEARAARGLRSVVALGCVALAARWMPVGYGTIQLEDRSIPSAEEVDRAWTRGLDTPLSEDVLWASRNVPSGDRVLAVDAGMLGAVPELRLIDSRGLTHRGFAEAAATRQEEPYMRGMVQDPERRPEWMRIANWDGSPMPQLPDWLTSVYHLREEVRYGPARIGWYSTHDRTADPETARRRLDALWLAYPSQPFLAWHAALQRAELGDMAGATEIAREGQRRWPHDPRFSQAPDSLAFPAGPYGLDQVAGRGTGLYWNSSIRSRPLSGSEISALKLRLDADAPGEEGAAAEVRWSGPCGEVLWTVAVHAVERRAPPPCSAEGTTRLTVRFTNDGSGPEGDRNLYVALVSADASY